MHQIFPQVENGISIEIYLFEYYILIPKGVIVSCAYLHLNYRVKEEYDRFEAYKLIGHFLKK